MAKKKDKISFQKSRSIIDGRLSSLFAELGFVHKKHDEFVRDGEVVARADVMLEVDRSADVAFIEMYVGIGHRSIGRLFEVYAGAKPKKRPAPAGCYHYIQNLPPKMPGIGWLINADDDEERFGDEICRCVEDRAVPFWQQCSSLDGLILVLSDPSHPFSGNADVLAAAYYLIGDQEAALRAIDHQLEQYKVWEQQYRQDYTREAERSRQFRAFLAGLTDAPTKRN